MSCRIYIDLMRGDVGSSILSTFGNKQCSGKENYAYVAIISFRSLISGSALPTVLFVIEVCTLILLGQPVCVSLICVGVWLQILFHVLKFELQR